MDDLTLHEAFYERRDESSRLDREPRGVLEKLRTQVVLKAALPESGVVFDIGGGAGVHALWLAQAGYAVDMFDPVRRHVDQADAAAADLAESAILRVELADARAIPREDESADAVLLLGPLYHLHQRDDRDKSLKEALRLLKPGGRLVAAGISRFAWLMDAYRQRLSDDPGSQQSIAHSLETGHSTTSPSPGSFWAYFHRPEDLQSEVELAGFVDSRIVALEGFAWMLDDLGEILGSEERTSDLLEHLSVVESEPSIVGASAHFVVSAQKPGLVTAASSKNH